MNFQNGVALSIKQLRSTFCRNWLVGFCKLGLGRLEDFLEYFGFTISKNDYWKPAAELVFDNEALNCQKVKLNMSPHPKIMVLKTCMVFVIRECFMNMNIITELMGFPFFYGR